MKKRFFVIIVSTISTILMLAACGGGGGGEVVAPITITDNTLVKYRGGEELNYNYSFRSVYPADGSDLVDYRGTMTTYIHSGLTISDLPGQELYRFITALTAGGVHVSENNHFFYDQSNNLIQYLSSNSNYFTNQSDPASGSLVLPHTLNAGDSWISPVFITLDGSNYNGSLTRTILGKEIVDVPFGKIETFKITVSGVLPLTPSFGLSSLSINNTLWIHPKIGIIKGTESLDRLFFGILQHISTTYNLVSTNMDVTQLSN